MQGTSGRSLGASSTVYSLRNAESAAIRMNVGSSAGAQRRKMKFVNAYAVESIVNGQVPEDYYHPPESHTRDTLMDVVPGSPGQDGNQRFLDFQREERINDTFYPH